MSTSGVNLQQLSEFIDEARQAPLMSSEVVDRLDRILELMTAFQKRLQAASDTSETDDLENCRRNDTYTHSVGIEWTNINMGIRHLVLKLRNRVEKLFGLLVSSDEVSELHIGLHPIPYFTVGRSRISLTKDSWGAESTVTGAHDPLGEKVVCENLENVNSILDLMLTAVVALTDAGDKTNADWITAKGRTPLEILDEFVGSLEESARQLEVEVASSL